MSSLPSQTVRFSLSGASSPSSSRGSSPTPYRRAHDQDAYTNGHSRFQDVLYPEDKREDVAYDDGSAFPSEKGDNDSASTFSDDLQTYTGDVEPPPGCLPSDVYDATLPWWRAALRRKLVKSIGWESGVLARMQDSIRTPWLDAYFVYTSSLGTNTFFMTVLPALFFFGYGEMGRGLLIVLALGVYTSSVVKDLLCSPRPFAPPVTRLTISTHHLEYGFPSTHSTNSVSIALFFFSHVYRLASVPVSLVDSSIASPAISPLMYYFFTFLLLLYIFSIVFGRLYTAMHSFSDCFMGAFMGVLIWFCLDSSAESGLGMGVGLGAGKWVEDWVRDGGWSVPLLLITVSLIMVNQHPQPVDDCPCFEDAVASVSVVLGALVARWFAVHWGFAAETFFVRTTPGSAAASWDGVAVWWLFAALKMTFGILAIFAWRLLAKSTLHVVLPPTFRFLARGFVLPHRRFYTPATDYRSVPSEFSGQGGLGLRAVPSVIDLPAGGVEEDVGGEAEEAVVSGIRDNGRLGGRGQDVKMRGRWDTTEKRSGNLGLGDRKPNKYGMRVASGLRNGLAQEEDKNGEMVKHYDADVLTKVIVYCGIAVLACEALPIAFEVVGWGVKSWV